MSLPAVLILPRPILKKRALIVAPKAWFAYLLLFLLLIFTNKGLREKLPGILGFASNISTDSIISLTNQARERNGLSSLRYNNALAAAAYSKAQHMFANDYWAHIAPDGTNPWYFFKEANYDYLFAGENLARDFNDSSGVVDAWLASPTHRDNLLGGRYSEIGVAVVNGVLGGEQTTLVVQMFGAPASNLVAIDSSPAIAPIVTAAPVPVATVSPTPARHPVMVSGPSLEVAANEEGVDRKESLFSPFVNYFQSSGYILTASGDRPSRFVNFSLIAKLSSILFIIFAGGGFFLDALVAKRWRIRRISGHTLAHIGLLAIALFALFYTSSGMIL